MAKSIRSKIKRKHRAEFRRTIGTEAANANMAIVQAKLQECINKGSMNSFDRLKAQMNGPAPEAEQQPTKDENEEEMMDDSMPAIDADAVDTTATAAAPMEVVAGQKNPDKIPVKAGKKKKKRDPIAAIRGQPGAQLAKKKYRKAKMRGQLKNGQKVVGKGQRKTRAPRKKYMCAF